MIPRAAGKSTAEQPRRGWYEGLDGVRGLAVFLVFTVHYLWGETRHVGWVGVQVFFVLSGFLITGILYDNREEQHRFRNFYWRRALRIFPLHYFIWLLVIPAAVAGGLLWRPVLWTWPAYLGNYARFLAGTTYVDRIPTRWGWNYSIGHFWSLAVEEQFYLLWPMVVFFVKRRETLIKVCVAVVLIVPVLRTVTTYLAPAEWLQNEFLYRMTFGQADAFLLGGLLALLMRGPEVKRIHGWGKGLLGGSLLALAVMMAFHRGRGGIAPAFTWIAQYGLSVFDLGSLGLILCAMERGSLIYRAMTWRPLSLLGRYSYGFYVYHVLLLPVFNWFWPAPHRSAVAIVEAGVDFMVIFLISAASYHLLEKPFLKFKDRFRTRHANPSLAQDAANGN